MKTRRVRAFTTPADGFDSAAFSAFAEEITFRRDVVCLPCYQLLDSAGGMTEIVGVKWINNADESQRDAAPTLTEDGYDQWRREEAAKLGMDI